MKPTLLILAAGMGSRYGGLKQIDKIGPSGEAIIDYSIYDAIRAGFGKVVLVIRPELEDDFRAFFGNKLDGKIEVQYVYQTIDNVPDGIEISIDRKKPWGTAHAILVAADAINEPFLAINADDFYGAEAYQAVGDFFGTNKDESTHCMVGYELGLTLSDFGTVSRGVCQYDKNLVLENITEVTNIEKKDSETGFTDPEKGWSLVDPKAYVSMNVWGFYPGIFDIFKKGFEQFILKAKDDPKAEYYIALPLMDMVANKEGTIKILQSDARWFGVTYREDKQFAIDKINHLVVEGKYPENLWG
jgi:hypothetical protein